MVLIHLLTGKEWSADVENRLVAICFFLIPQNKSPFLLWESKWSEISFLCTFFRGGITEWSDDLSGEQLSRRASGWGQMSLGLFVLILECFGWEVKGSSSQAEDCGEFRHNFGPRARRTWFLSQDQWPTSCVGKSVRLPEPSCFLLWSQGVGSSAWSPPTLCFCELELTHLKQEVTKGHLSCIPVWLGRLREASVWQG